MNTQVPISIIRLPEVIHLTGLSRPTIYRRIAEGKFPNRVLLGERAIGFKLHEVIAWIENLEVKQNGGA
ncbi:AlpA family transcriptional regulator [Vibrio sp. ZSDE26]|uniref:AlpA family transcriptional regulator n=1 Tax=Vibrio amylolyticus TaxID=2847292 RepID=A0A9X2BL78_9VIBR|nr:AlpA family transcriptional regulator [Vibrio amylolyticus]MCK6265372.1 AlpA family transcriptional regulator [Vibrio amylolyticus]